MVESLVSLPGQVRGLAQVLGGKLTLTRREVWVGSVLVIVITVCFFFTVRPSGAAIELTTPSASESSEALIFGINRAGALGMNACH